MRTLALAMPRKLPGIYASLINGNRVYGTGWMAGCTYMKFPIPPTCAYPGPSTRFPPPIGNYVVAGDDHAVGSGVIIHQQSG